MMDDVFAGILPRRSATVCTYPNNLL